MWISIEFSPCNYIAQKNYLLLHSTLFDKSNCKIYKNEKYIYMITIYMLLTKERANKTESREKNMICFNLHYLLCASFWGSNDLSKEEKLIYVVYWNQKRMCIITQKPLWKGQEWKALIRSIYRVILGYSRRNTVLICTINFPIISKISISLE